MSLSSFLKMADVRARLKPVRPKLTRKTAVPLKVEPRSNRYEMVGTAFDYLLRFELRRRAPHAVTRPWVAEQALRPDLVDKEEEFLGMRLGEELGLGTDALQHLSQDDFKAKCPGDVEFIFQGRIRAVLEKAKSAVAAYVTNTSPTHLEQADLAAHAIRLAKLDPVPRVHEFDPSFELASPDDVEDLLALLEIVPFDALFHERILLLNPTFGETSKLVGGADADLIKGDMLVDFKTTKASELQTRYLDQLFGYYLLARHQRQTDPTFPEIEQVAIYFCRHGYLWIADVVTWTDNPHFSEVEEWFFNRAKEVFGKQRGQREFAIV